MTKQIVLRVIQILLTVFLCFAVLFFGFFSFAAGGDGNIVEYNLIESDPFDLAIVFAVLSNFAAFLILVVNRRSKIVLFFLGLIFLINGFMLLNMILTTSHYLISQPEYFHIDDISVWKIPKPY